MRRNCHRWRRWKANCTHFFWCLPNCTIASLEQSGVSRGSLYMFTNLHSRLEDPKMRPWKYSSESHFILLFSTTPALPFDVPREYYWMILVLELIGWDWFKKNRYLLPGKEWMIEWAS
jgi:hypothetical protein